MKRSRQKLEAPISILKNSDHAHPKSTASKRKEVTVMMVES